MPKKKKKTAMKGCTQQQLLLCQNELITCGSPNMLGADSATIQLDVWYVATSRLGV